MLPIRGALRQLPRTQTLGLHTAASISRPSLTQARSLVLQKQPIYPHTLSKWPVPGALRAFSATSRIGVDVVPPPTPTPASDVPKTPSKRRVYIRRTLLVFKGLAFLIGSAVVGVSLVTGVILAHDSLTYSEPGNTHVRVHPQALNPPRGGPKNLLIAKNHVDDQEDADKAATMKKPKLVIVGAGWGAMGILKTLNSGDYHVTVVADETFNHFTPLLPSAAVGTVSVRSLVESVRKLLRPLHGHFIHGRAVDLAMSERLLEVEVVVDTHGKKQRIYVPYDKLIIAVGSVSATYGVRGLEHCFQLKTIEDAQKIRRRIVENFEIASLPTTSPEERRRLLSFVVCGGGPTGVETAAEIADLVHEDMAKYYPKLCANEASVSIIQSRDHILNTYSQSISEYAEKRFEREAVNVITNARVKQVTDHSVIYSVKDPKTDKVEELEIPTNFTLWSTGIAMNPFTERVTDLLPNQVHKKASPFGIPEDAITVDAHMRVKGAPLGTVYCIGDASTIETSLLPYLLDLIESADTNKDEKIDYDEWKALVEQVKRRVPMASMHLEKAREVFKQYDIDSDDALSFNELTEALVEIGKKITSLPATAQVASQQGKYLGKKFCKLAQQRRVMKANDVADEDDAVYAEPFKYEHLGSLAYIGNAAVFDLPGYSFTGGLAAMYAWRSVYWSEQVSFRTRTLLMVDWVVRGLFGRDLSKL
ncbi:hypothetical protein FRB99_005160 [Tulasnella sp. 403]|nr:hypothetical protein FRB99_005160 [Tulasnella sp. 403]